MTGLAEGGETNTGTTCRIYPIHLKTEPGSDTALFYWEKQV